MPPPPIPPKDKTYEVRRRSVAPDRVTQKFVSSANSSKRRSVGAPPIPPKKNLLAPAGDVSSEQHAQSLRENFGTLYLSNVIREGRAFGQVHAVDPDVVYEVSMPNDKLNRFRAQIREARFVCELSRQDLESRRNDATPLSQKKVQ